MYARFSHWTERTGPAARRDCNSPAHAQKRRDQSALKVVIRLGRSPARASCAQLKDLFRQQSNRICSRLSSTLCVSADYFATAILGHLKIIVRCPSRALPHELQKCLLPFVVLSSCSVTRNLTPLHSFYTFLFTLSLSQSSPPWHLWKKGSAGPTLLLVSSAPAPKRYCRGIKSRQVQLRRAN